MAGKGGGGNLGKASLVLGTKDAGLKRGLNKSKQDISGWASSFKGKILGAAAGVGASLGGLLSVGKVVSNTGDLSAAGKQAEALGIASDTFMGLAAAAKRAGIESEQFGTLLQKGQLRVAEGSDETVNAINLMGLTLADLRGKSPDQIFFAVSRGLEGVSDAGTKAVIATKLYEEEGLKLLPVFAKGEQGLRAYIAQMKAQGVAIDGEQMSRVMKAQTTIDDMQQRVQGFWNKVTVAAAPFIELGGRLIDTVWKWAPPFAAVESVGVGALRAIGVAGAYVWDSLKVVGAGIQFLTSAWVGLFGAVQVGLGKLFGALAQIPRQMGQFGQADWKVIGDALTAAGNARIDHERQVSNGAIATMQAFGSSAETVHKFFNDLQMKAPATGAALAQPIANVMADAPAVGARAGEQLAAALERGTREEYSARVRFETGGQNWNAQQLGVSRQIQQNTAATAAAVRDLARKQPARQPTPGSV